MQKVSLYVDTFKDGSVDKAATEMAVKLRDEKLPRSIYKRNCKRFEIDWSGFEGVSLESHSSYFTGQFQSIRLEVVVCCREREMKGSKKRA